MVNKLIASYKLLAKTSVLALISIITGLVGLLFGHILLTVLSHYIAINGFLLISLPIVISFVSVCIVLFIFKGGTKAVGNEIALDDINKQLEHMMKMWQFHEMHQNEYELEILRSDIRNLEETRLKLLETQVPGFKLARDRSMVRRVLSQIDMNDPSQNDIDQILHLSEEYREVLNLDEFMREMRKIEEIKRKRGY